MVVLGLSGCIIEQLLALALLKSGSDCAVVLSLSCCKTGIVWDWLCSSAKLVIDKLFALALLKSGNGCAVVALGLSCCKI